MFALRRLSGLAAALALVFWGGVARGSSRSALAAEAHELELRWAPNFAQAVSRSHPERDRPLPMNFDGDWDATNNWRDLTPAMRSRRPAVYGAAILTRTHGYLMYTLFYPRDWITPWCVSLICHDNDLESVLVVVRRKSPGHPDGKLVLVESKAHNGYPWLPAAKLALDAGGHPQLRVESEGHGIYPVRTHERLDDAADMRLVPPGDDARDADTVRYKLLSLHDTLWARRAAGAVDGKLWAAGDTGFLGYRGTRMGRRGEVLGDWTAQTVYTGGVRPPWGVVAVPGTRGDWFLDPAFVEVARHPDVMRADGPPSLSYVFNPFLDELTASCVGKACPVAPRPPHGLFWLWGSLGAMFVGLGLVSTRMWRRRGSIS